LNPLLDELLRAFPLVPLDAKGAFHWYADAEFCERAIHNKTWDQVDLRLIGGRDDALAFLRPERFIQWLPAYLNQLVVVRPESSPIWGGLMSRLTAPDPAIVKDRKRRKFEELGNSLTPAQRQAVARTLQLAIERYPNWGEQPRLALDRYWSAFAETSTVTQDPLLSDLRAAFPPIVIADVFVDDDWRYCELYDYRRAIEGKTWEQIDPLFLVHHAEALEYLGERAVRAVLPMHVHLMLVFAATWASPYVIAAIDRVTLNDAQREVIARYRAAFA
jgi:hypothetical protein